RNDPVLKTVGGVYGVGLIAPVVRGYAFISQHYNPGDFIHLVGFSRGAYTARVLAGMIGRGGLLNKGTYDVEDKSNSYLLAMEAWLKVKNTVFSREKSLFSRLTESDALSMVARGRLKEDQLIPGVRVKSVGVWDSVGSMGIPTAYLSGTL